MKKFILILIIATAFTSILFSQANLYYFITQRIGAYGPIYGEEEVNSSRITSLLFSKPLTTNSKMEIASVLFVEPLPSGVRMEDGRIRYSFEVQPEIYWHDGEELTAEDIEFTFNVISNPRTESSNARSKIEKIESMTSTSRYGLDVYFNQRDEDNISALTFNVLPKHCFTSSEIEESFISPTQKFFLEKPIGCGVYKRKSIYEGRETILETNQDYFLSKDIPRFNTIKIRKKEIVANMIQEFIEDDEVNFFPNFPVNELHQIKQVSSLFDYVKFNEYSWNFIAFNLRKPIFENPLFREALIMSVDKQQMNEEIYKENAEIIHGPFPPNSPAYYSECDFPLYDTGIAKTKLIEAQLSDSDGDGYIDIDGENIKLKFILQVGKEDDKLTQVSILNFFKEIGIDIEAEYLDYDDFTKKVFMDHDFDMALVSYKFGTDPDVSTIFHSKYKDKIRGNNVCGFAFDDVDKKIEEALRKPTRVVRMQLYQQIHQLIVNHYPGIFLWQKPVYVAFDRVINDDSDREGISEDTLDPINIFRYIHRW